MDDAWVDEVRRWYYGGEAPATDRDDLAGDASLDIGYEAAHPALLNVDSAALQSP